MSTPGSLIDYDFGDGSPIVRARNPIHDYAGGTTFMLSIGAVERDTILRLALPSSKQTELVLTEMRVLEELRVQDNKLTTLNLLENPSLKKVDFTTNQFSTIDFTNNRLLEEAVLNDNLLTAPIFPNNRELFKLHLQNNGLTAISVVDNPKMKDLDISQNATLTGDQVGQILIELDEAGLHSGVVNYVGNATPGLGFLSVYNSLQAKGWNILGPIPSDGSVLLINASGDALLINASGDKLAIE